ncbi:LUC7-domain-containing protein [Setomelanomma holmii]|uniref:LUC7-domain-containing protein n=1 Tax=Setomelanomma holmii TaxID=210430 RepID=A0A9P4H1M1_9PLEO|nr:LUC7-domain-containing protein [Setomelanomma holmii]
MAAAETRRLLEQLMGEQLMSGTDQRAPQLSITDPKVCRSYVVGNCPHDLFTNTKNELGPCPKVHNEALKTEYQEADADQKRRWGFEFDYMRDMQHHIDSCNRKIDSAQRRLEKTPEEIRQTNALLKAINELTKSIEAGMLEIQIMGEEGMVNMAVQEFTKLRYKKAEKEERERELRALSDTGGPSGHQKLQVCDVCGAYLSRLDNDRRLADHFYGKMHLGYAQMRKSYETLQKELKGRAPPRDAYASSGGDMNGDRGDQGGWGGGYGGGGFGGGRGGRRGRGVTNNVLELTSAPNAHGQFAPSSRHLAKRRAELIFKRKIRRQDDPIADVQENLLTLGGRIYITNATIAGQVYSLVIDSGSADTWVASSNFRCVNPDMGIAISTRYYPNIPPIFSLALRRATVASPRAGGQLAIGGIPTVKNDGRWVTVPLRPVVQDIYGWYSVTIDGFAIIPPNITTTTTTHSMSPTPTPTPTTHKYANAKADMIIESGTSLLYFPDHVASLFIPPTKYNAYSNTYIVSYTAKAPRVGVRIGGRRFFMSEDDRMTRGPGAVGGANVGAGKGQCAVAVQRAEGGTLVLGDAWLSNVLVVFELANGTDIGVGGSDENDDGVGSVRIVGREVY